MIKLTYRYIGLKYLKSFLIVLLALVVFFSGIEILQNFSRLPASANLKLLYIIYNIYFQMTIILPLSLSFGFILFIIGLIRNNIFIALYSLGVTKKMVIVPVIVIGTFVLSLLIVGQSTSLAYSEYEKKKILRGTYLQDEKNSLFLKYNNNFVYFKKLYPLKNKAVGIKIFEIKNKKLISTTKANSAIYIDNHWQLTDVVILKYEKDGLNKFQTKRLDSLKVLKGFKPKIMDKVYDIHNNYSIKDAIDTYDLLSKQNINTDTIRTSFYWTALSPFFVLPLILMIFSYTPINSRFFNTNRYVMVSLTSTIMIWATLFLLYKVASNGTLVPEVALIVPLLFLNILSIYIYNKKSRAI